MSLFKKSVHFDEKLLLKVILTQYRLQNFTCGNIVTAFTQKLLLSSFEIKELAVLLRNN